MSTSFSKQDQVIIDNFCQYSFWRKKVSDAVAENGIENVKRLYLDIMDQMVRDNNTTGIAPLVNYIGKTIKPAHYHHLLSIGINTEWDDYFIQLPIYTSEHLRAMSKANCRLLFDRMLNLFDDELTEAEPNDNDVQVTSNDAFIARAQEVLSSLMGNEGHKLKAGFIKQIEARESLFGTDIYGNIMASYLTIIRMNELNDKTSPAPQGVRKRHEYASL